MGSPRADSDGNHAANGRDAGRVSRLNVVILRAPEGHVAICVLLGPVVASFMGSICGELIVPGSGRCLTPWHCQPDSGCPRPCVWWLGP